MVKKRSNLNSTTWTSASKELSSLWSMNKMTAARSLATSQSAWLDSHKSSTTMSAALKAVKVKILPASWEVVLISIEKPTLQCTKSVQDRKYAALEQFSMSPITSAQERQHACFPLKSLTALNLTIQTSCYRIAATLPSANTKILNHLSNSQMLKLIASKSKYYATLQKLSSTLERTMEKANAPCYQEPSMISTETLTLPYSSPKNSALQSHSPQLSQTDSAALLMMNSVWSTMATISPLPVRKSQYKR